MGAADDYPWLARDQTMGQGCYYPHPQGLAAIEEIDRLRTENEAFRAQFKDADEMAAEFRKWYGDRNNLPEGWKKVE